ncbi:MAG: transcription-repair coupling factor [Acetivibrionales bacterium]|jgi:transcription-repair coupling factor (superfamily II helicase)|nr:transcription-repair coupling factor [Clostridiaceae bacterium]
MKLITSAIKNSQQIKRLLKLVQTETDAAVHGVSDSQKRHLANTVTELSGLKGLYVAWNEMQARQAYLDLSYLTNNKTVYLSNREIMLYDVEARSFEQTQDRISALARILNGDYNFIVTSAEALMHFIMDPEVFAKKLINLKPGDTVDWNNFEEKLLELGYNREEKVEGRGQYSKRGGILDIYPVNCDMPCRIEFFDIEIDSMRWFSEETQRSVDQCDELNIYPAREIVYDRSEIGAIAGRIREALAQTLPHISSELRPLLTKNIERYVEKLHDSHYFTGVDKFIPYLIEKKASLFDYLNGKHLVFFEESQRTRERMENEQETLGSLCETLMEKGMVLKDTFSMLFDLETLMERTGDNIIVTLESLDENLSWTSRQTERIDIRGSGVSPYNGKLDLLSDDIIAWLKDGFRVAFMCSSKDRVDRFAEELREKGVKASKVDEEATWPEGVSVVVVYGHLQTGFVYKDEKLVILAESDISGIKSGQTKRRFGEKGKRISSFTDLKIGDFVVHQAHGIGVYNGIEQLVVEGIRKDYLKISYKDGGTLFIPTTNMDLIQKYIGAEGREPRLNKLGGTEWTKAKARVKESLRALADDLIRLQAERRNTKGYAFSPDTVWQKQFEDMFAFEETPDQLRCVAEIKADMESELIMDRLLCGDVGYGKTEVAIRAAFKAVMDGKQVAFLVPTTVLAAQHFETFKKRFSGFPIKVEMLSRFRSDAEQKAIIKDLKSGRMDIVVGTHMILGESVKFKDLGLLIIDEEQRFGVEHKETIKLRHPKVDILTLSATPIPRTLNMSLSGIRDISTLEDPPEHRYPVQTYVVEHRDDIIQNAINRELARGGQVFYLFNRVRGILGKMSQIQALVPEARIGYAHGQMGERELERVIQSFLDKDFDVLVCTTIIESGIDMPNVNTIIVEDSDRLGLAQLYQLRGRVGRSNRLAYAYLTYKRDKVLSEIAEKRLRAIREFTEFGSGFKIAMRDLQIRGAGNILGAEQHGHMESVGYDMYLKLLDETVTELKGEAVTNRAVDTAVELLTSAYIDASYIKDEEQRIDMYRTIATIETEEDILDIKDELIDRYGDIPAETNQLIEIAYIKNLASHLGFSSVKQKEEMVLFNFAEQAGLPLERIGEIMSKWKGKILFSAGKQPYLSLRSKNEKSDEVIENIKILLQELQKLQLKP